ncbi:MAG: hypothetical protein AB7I30_14275 [Isosphaeraceae bacterium]
MAGVDRAWVGVALLWALGCSGGEVPADPAPEVVLPTISTRPEGTVEERLVKAKELAREGDRSKAIEVLEEALLIDHKDRETLALLARYGREESRAVAETDPGRAYRLMVSAGGYLRELGAAYPDATDEEKALQVDVLYDEASAHARSKRVEETVGALRDAVAAGFRDFDRLRADKDWAEMLTIPQFQKPFEEITASAEKK